MNRARARLSFARWGERRYRDGLSSLAALYLEARWQLRLFLKPRKRRKTTSDAVVVSLTSYPPRYSVLAKTIKSLLMQTVTPDCVELWIADRDIDALPKSVTALEAHGLHIRRCADLRSYKKIIPALEQHPTSVIVTADDDAYYWPTWLEELLVARDPAVKEVLCHRAHTIACGADGRPAPYRNWSYNTKETTRSNRILPTGLGGILYPPGVFASDVARSELFQRYCPTADDIWLFWMASLNQASFRKVGPPRDFILWRGGQDVALYNDNGGERELNDQQIAAMIGAYGVPFERQPGTQA